MSFIFCVVILHLWRLCPTHFGANDMSFLHLWRLCYRGRDTTVVLKIYSKGLYFLLLLKKRHLTWFSMKSCVSFSCTRPHISCILLTGYYCLPTRWVLIYFSCSTPYTCSAIFSKTDYRRLSEMSFVSFTSILYDGTIM